MKTITLCSDDFGENDAISQGILELVKNRRLQAVTVFSEASGWQTHGLALLECSQQIDIGIHLNLTHDFNQQAPIFSLGELLVKSHLRLIDKTIIKDSFRRQIDAFTRLAGCLPNFLDGHQHVHGFPVVSEALCELITEYWPSQKNLYVRNSSQVNLSQDGFFIKKLILRVACFSLAPRLNRLSVQSPQSFSGIYDFDPNTNLNQLFNRWLMKCQDGTLFMCHPATPGSSDSLGPARANEFNYLNSQAFIDACARYEVTLDTYTNYLAKHP